MTVVEAQAFCARYSTRKSGTVQAVQDFDLSVAPGEFVTLIGPSGCGKSTFLRAVADLHAVSDTEGSLRVVGGPARKARLAREVSFMFQRPALLPWRTVLENVRIPLEIARVSDPLISPLEMLELVGLTGFEDALPRELSGGMQQRAAIARSLILTPQLLLMDEPFGAVDEITRERLNLALLEIWQRSGSAVLFVTHSLAEAVFMSDRIVVITERPARVAGIVDVGLPRPRGNEVRTLPQFQQLENEVRELLIGGGR